jgi:hypothetical protein
MAAGEEVVEAEAVEAEAALSMAWRRRERLDARAWRDSRVCLTIARTDL